jgi:hypothetical protein
MQMQLPNHLFVCGLSIYSIFSFSKSKPLVRVKSTLATAEHCAEQAGKRVQVLETFIRGYFDAVVGELGQLTASSDRNRDDDIPLRLSDSPI